VDELSPKSRNLWARFAAQETGPQKVLFAVAAIITALATIVGAGVGIFQLVGQMTGNGSSSAGDLTTRKGQILVEQGSPEADDLVRDFVESHGDRIELNAMVLGQAGDADPQWIFHLWYNCQGLGPDQSPGEDRCDRAAFIFDDQNPSPPSYDRPDRVELTGTWADNRPSELGYGAKGLKIFPVRAS
jgi:hypothetical protein